MKNLILPFLLLSALSTSAQNILKSEKITDHSTYIKSNDIEGVVFNNTYVQNANDTLESTLKRFTPSIEDILLTESILKTELKKNHKNKDYKVILSHLKEYRRQYIGYYDKDGDRVVYINSFPSDLNWADKKIEINNSKNKISTWYNSLFTVFDGGNSFWQANINLQKKKLVGLTVNGVA